jgi:electron transport complex protein RnfG
VRSIKHFIQQSWLLIVASFCFGLLIAVTNASLSPRIEKNKINKFNDLALGLLPDAKDFVPLDKQVEVQGIRGKTDQVTIYKAISETGECVGWSFTAAGSGFADKIELVIAVDKDFKKLAGFDCLASNETPGFGDRIKNNYYRGQFQGAPAGKLMLIKAGDPEKIDSEIVAITGATVSSEAVIKIINHYITRVREQMLQEGLLTSDSGQ